MWYKEEKCNFLKVFLQNIWWERKFCIPLHPLYKTSHLASYFIVPTFEAPPQN